MIKFSHISKAFEGKILFEDASLSLSNKGLYLLIGENGTGKSTLLKILASLDYTCPFSLQVQNTTLDDKQKRIYLEDNAAYVNQAPILFDKFNVLENILIPYQSKDKDKAIELLKTLHIEQLKDHDVTSLSEGEKARLCLARALFKNPKILLLDEICAGLDIENTKNVDHILQELSRSVTIVLVTHKKEEIENFSNYHLLTIEEEKIHQEEEKEETEETKEIVLTKKSKTCSLFDRNIKNVCVPFVSCLTFLVSLTIIFFSLGTKWLVQPTYPFSYLFDNYPYLVVTEESYSQYLPQNRKYLFDVSFEAQSLVKDTKEENLFYSTFFIHEYMDTSNLPTPSIGSLPKAENEFMLSSSRYESLLSTLLLDRDATLETVNQVWRSTYNRTETIVGVYPDFSVTTQEIKDYLKECMYSDKRLSFNPRIVFSVLDYGTSTLFTFKPYSDTISVNQTSFFINEEIKKEMLSEYLLFDNILSMYSLNPYLIKDDVPFPADTLYNSRGFLILSGLVCLVITLLSLLIFALLYVLLIKSKIILFKAISGNTYALYRRFRNKILLYHLAGFIGSLLLVVLTLTICQTVFASMLLFGSSLVFLNLAFYIFLPFIFLPISLGVLSLTNRLLFGSDPSKQLKELE